MSQDTDSRDSVGQCLQGDRVAGLLILKIMSSPHTLPLPPHATLYVVSVVLGVCGYSNFKSPCQRMCEPIEGACSNKVTTDSHTGYSECPIGVYSDHVRRSYE